MTKRMCTLRRRWATGLAVVALAAVQTPARGDEERAAEPATIEALGWLAGCWGEKTEARETVECWTGPRGGFMLGLHRDARADGRASFEFLRIAETPEGVVYLASPGGREPTPFPLVEAEGKSVVFANPEHDFPRKISYRLDDAGLLHARAEGEIGGQPRALEWTWSATDFPR